MYDIPSLDSIPGANLAETREISIRLGSYKKAVNMKLKIKLIPVYRYHDLKSANTNRYQFLLIAISKRSILFKRPCPKKSAKCGQGGYGT